MTRVRYTALISATLIGFVVWREMPDAWVVVGAAAIIASGLDMVRGERRRLETRDRRLEPVS
jgi:drug/metabolite transporter (DMT)-like permease